MLQYFEHTFLIIIVYYSFIIASMILNTFVGHFSTQVPQELHFDQMGELRRFERGAEKMKKEMRAKR
jgi:hypothetical protein